MFDPPRCPVVRLKWTLPDGGPPQVSCESCGKPNHPWRMWCAWCGCDKKTVLAEPREERDGLTF